MRELRQGAAGNRICKRLHVYCFSQDTQICRTHKLIYGNGKGGGVQYLRDGEQLSDPLLRQELHLLARGEGAWHMIKKQVREDYTSGVLVDDVFKNCASHR